MDGLESPEDAAREMQVLATSCISGDTPGAEDPESTEDSSPALPNAD
jgi:hypothetical protein